ncbi:MAG: hypothetical protein AAF639_31760 [Chloroflexota bacterium]
MVKTEFAPNLPIFLGSPLPKRAMWVFGLSVIMVVGKQRNLGILPDMQSACESMKRVPSQ